MKVSEMLDTMTPSSPPLPAATWEERLKTVHDSWPTVEQIAQLAATLANAFPAAKPDALADKALSLWQAANRRIIRLIEDSREYERASLSWADDDYAQIPKPPSYPTQFDLALRLMVGKKTRLPDRHRKFRDYLKEGDPENWEKEFAKLKQHGFGERDFRVHFVLFESWRKLSEKLMRKTRARKAAQTRHPPKF